MAKDMLYPFEGIDKRMLEMGIKSCFDNGTMYCQRIQVKRGRLYVQDYRAIFFDRHYAPSRIMPILETLRRHPSCSSGCRLLTAVLKCLHLLFTPEQVP